MRKLTLTALLAFSSALAGGYMPAATSVPVSSAAPAPAVRAASSLVIPALPLNAAPARTAPAATPAPTTAATAARFLLTAPSGTSVTLTQTVRAQVELEDVQVTGSAAEELSAADIQEMKDAFAAMSAQELPAGELTMSVGEVFADGSRELVTTILNEMPAESGMEDFTIRVIQTVQPGGQVSATRVESDDADMQALFAGMSEEMLGSMNGSDAAQVYGFPLTVGHTVTTTDETDMQGLLAGLLGGAASMAAGEDMSEADAAQLQQLFSSVRAEPLSTVNALTYRGRNAAGQHVFHMTSTAAQPWNMTLDTRAAQQQPGAAAGDQPGGPFVMSMTLSDMNVSGDLTYRPDGLPSALSTTQDMRMKMDMTLGGEDAGSMSMTMRIKAATDMRTKQ